MKKNLSIAIIGLGYVGLPLALEFGKKFKTIGYDISNFKIKALLKNIDLNKEFKKKEIINSKFLNFTNDPANILECKFKIVAVPTPITKNKKPDLKIIKNACKIVGINLKKGDIVIFESTVYPGVTEDICVKILETFSNLKWKKDFNVGYSPERINPGDKDHYLTNINKLISADNKKTLNLIKKIYKSIVKANIIPCDSIKIAEAAKVIENTQRDINIAFINELKIIFDKLKIDTKKVLDASSTKWNFLNFQPGLVGGHCIGVDPYYLSYRSSKSGYNPKIILSGRKINNSMPEFVVKNFINGMKAKKIKIKNSKILILGLTFKENCPDVRNSKVFSVIEKLKAKSINVFVHDPWITIDKSKDYDFNMINEFNNIKFDGIILAVGHDKFKMFNDYILKKLSKKNYFLYDLKNFFKKSKLVNLTL